MSNPVNWFEIYVQDMPRAKSFYEKVLGVKLVKLSMPDIEMYAFPMEMEAPGCTGSLVKMSDVPSGGNSTMIYFQCDDCTVEEARVAGAGGTVQRPKMSIGEYGFISLVVDTEGNMIGLHSQK